MKLFKHITFGIVFFISMLHQKIHSGDSIEKTFHKCCNSHSVPQGRKEEEYDAFISRLNSLSSVNKNAVIVLLDSLYQQELDREKEEFTLYTDKGCVHYRPSAKDSKALSRV